MPEEFALDQSSYEDSTPTGGSPSDETGLDTQGLDKDEGGEGVEPQAQQTQAPAAATAPQAAGTQQATAATQTAPGQQTQPAPHPGTISPYAQALMSDAERTEAERLFLPEQVDFIARLSSNIAD